MIQTQLWTTTRGNVPTLTILLHTLLIPFIFLKLFDHNFTHNKILYCVSAQKALFLTHQTVKLWYRALVSWVTNVPDLDASLPSCVNVSGGITDSNSAHHLSMVQCVDLTGMAWDPWAYQSIWGEWYRLHLSISRHVKRVSPDDTKEDEIKMEKEGDKEYIKKMWRHDGRGGKRKVFLGHWKANVSSQSSNIQAATNALTVCRREFLSDWEAFQELAYEDEDQNQPWGGNTDILRSQCKHMPMGIGNVRTGQY